ncbi:MAG TPA: HD domain-containing phosphohydrolase [Roseiflexaceae bacterium]|nr:HD domain-containing phosphohydrolase [Roseiflexaceae bacterium]
MGPCPTLDIPYAHHERWDGSGYPRGLRGEAIPLAARLFTVVDVWEALTSDRPYRPAWPPERALAYWRRTPARTSTCGWWRRSRRCWRQRVVGSARWGGSTGVR